MRLTALNRGELLFSPHLPTHLNHLKIPGSEPSAASTPFGHFLYQKIETRHFRLWRHWHQPKEDVILHFQSEPDRIWVRLVLHSHVHHQLTASRNLYLKQGQFNVVSQPSGSGSFLLRGERDYDIVDICLERSWLEQLGLRFNALDHFLRRIRGGETIFLLEEFGWINAEILDTLPYFIQFPQDETIATQFLRLLMVSAENSRNRFALSEQHIERLFDSREIIRSDLASWYEIPILAKKVGLNEFTFKHGFKEIFDFSPYQYLKYEKFKRARELLKHSSLSIEEIAHQTGFSSVRSFGPAFKKEFNMTATQWRKFGERFLYFGNKR